MDNGRSRVFVSNPDLDGVSYIVFLRLFEIPHDSIVIEDYQHIDTDDFSHYIAEFDEIFYVDYAPNLDFYNQLIAKGREVWVFDHHERSAELPKTDRVFVDMEECGTSLFWENYVKPNYVQEMKPIYEHFVTLVKTYDLWKKTDPLWEDAKGLNSICYNQHNYRTKNVLDSFFPYIDAQERKLHYWDEWEFTLPERQAIERAEQREYDMYEQAMVEIQRREDTRGNKFAVFSLPSKISAVAGMILEEDLSLSYVVVANTYNGITGKASVRSLGFDCRSLQLPDGHTEAAGFHVRPNFLSEFLSGDKWSLAYGDEPTRSGFRKKQ